MDPLYIYNAKLVIIIALNTLHHFLVYFFIFSVLLHRYNIIETDWYLYTRDGALHLFLVMATKLKSLFIARLTVLAGVFYAGRRHEQRRHILTRNGLYIQRILYFQGKVHHHNIKQWNTVCQ